MQNKFYKIFKKRKNIIVGVIHLPPLLGYSNFPGFKTALKNALSDLAAFEKGGVDGIIFENNYDIPHKSFVGPSVMVAMAFLGEKIKSVTKLPLGVNVLWNDYYAALSLAKVLGLQFVRIPVFVDKVKTDCGIIEGQPGEVIKFRKSLKAGNVALFTDIHVKHSKLLSRDNLVASARLAVRNYSDAVIVTGKWTGQPPDLEELKSLRKAIGTFPILVGSGTDKDNIQSLLKYADGVIVSTSLKKGRIRQGKVNLKSYQQRISKAKVETLVRQVAKI